MHKEELKLLQIGEDAILILSFLELPFFRQTTVGLISNYFFPLFLQC